MFVQEYLVDLNATQAAIRTGYSPKTAEVQGCRLLSKAKIADAVQKGIDKRSAKIGITAEKVLENIERIAQKAEEADEYSAALKGHELLGRHLKLFTDKVELSGNVELAERLKDAREKTGR
jgi:phage terminase small subunit